MKLLLLLLLKALAFISSRGAEWVGKWRLNQLNLLHTLGTTMRTGTTKPFCHFLGSLTMKVHQQQAKTPNSPRPPPPRNQPATPPLH